jgi:hypothetical protein
MGHAGAPVARRWGTRRLGGRWPMMPAGAGVLRHGLTDGATDPPGLPELEGRAVAGGARVGNGVAV